ncbi:MAG: hypothetical protein ACR5LG_01555 [Sodalis sp. (in: enterobacteria)]|uniref:hypothetical protein n=1 Tax=Sodalis sp. (in: enterobacteria) TaxID=1898979 RepID=UPI003F2F1919
MANGRQRLSYEIYQANGNTRWGSSGAERVASAAAVSVTGDGFDADVQLRGENRQNANDTADGNLHR